MKARAARTKQLTPNGDVVVTKRVQLTTSGNVIVKERVHASNDQLRPERGAGKPRTELPRGQVCGPEVVKKRKLVRQKSLLESLAFEKQEGTLAVPLKNGKFDHRTMTSEKQEGAGINIISLVEVT